MKDKGSGPDTHAENLIEEALYSLSGRPVNEFYGIVNRVTERVLQGSESVIPERRVELSNSALYLINRLRDSQEAHIFLWNQWGAAEYRINDPNKIDGDGKRIKVSKETTEFLIKHGILIKSGENIYLLNKTRLRELGFE